MKPYLFIVLFLTSFIGISQNNYIVKTEDGRRVLLKADFTWEYIDLETPKETTTKIVAPKPLIENNCAIASDFEEPKLDKKTQAQLKKGRATIEHIKKKVAKDFKCSIEDVILLSARETKANGTYHFCANGIKTTYKRNGHSIAKKISIKI